MKKAIKKLTSFLLCAAFVLSIVPIAPWQGGNMASAADSYTYKFARATGTSGGNTTDATNSKWEFIDDSQGTSITITPNPSSALTLTSSGNWGAASTTQKKVMQIYVPETGKYSLSFVCGADSLSTSVQVLASSSTSCTVADNKIGDIPRTTTAEDGYFTAKMTKEITVMKPGYWTIVFYRPVTIDGYRLILDNLVLTKTAEIEAQELVYNLNNVTGGGSAYTPANSEWQTVGHNATSCTVQTASGASYLRLDAAADRYVTFKMYIPAKGKYTASVKRYRYYDSSVKVLATAGNVTDINTIKNSGTALGTYSYSNAGGFLDVQLANQLNVSEPGYYNITFLATSPYEYVCLASLTLTPVIENVEITEKAKFGDVSAYITKTESGAYNFTAFSGIDTTEYSEVGFIINGDYVPVAGNAVYKKVTVSYNDNQTMDITPSSFFKSGAPETSYVFYSTKDLGTGFTGEVTFKPYAVEVGKTREDAIVGYPYSVTLS